VLAASGFGLAEPLAKKVLCKRYQKIIIAEKGKNRVQIRDCAIACSSGGPVFHTRAW
jgi:hypothetical protein